MHFEIHPHHQPSTNQHDETISTELTKQAQPLAKGQHQSTPCTLLQAAKLEQDAGKEAARRRKAKQQQQQEKASPKAQGTKGIGKVLVRRGRG